MTMRVLISAPYMQPVMDRFIPLFDQLNVELVIPAVRERLEEQDLLLLVGDVDGVICGDDRFTRKVLQSAPRLKVISKWGTGIDSIDQEACRALGIAVRNTPNAFSEPVADSVLGYMLSFARRIPWTTSAMKSGQWHKIPGFSLAESTLGVIGIGNVGKAVIRRAAAFGMSIIGNDIVPVPIEYQKESGIGMASLAELLAKADFVSINCDLNPTSMHLLNDETIGMMKKTAVVINTARGPIIDEKALIRALQAHKIAGAALDVFEQEPLQPSSPLLAMDNVLLAPHNANSSPAAWERVHINTIRNLLEVLGLPLPEVWPKAEKGELPCL